MNDGTMKLVSEDLKTDLANYVGKRVNYVFPLSVLA